MGARVRRRTALIEKPRGERNKEVAEAAANSLCACQPADNMSSAAEHARTSPPRSTGGSTRGT